MSFSVQRQPQSAGDVPPSLLIATAAAQTTELATADHVKFNAVVLSEGHSIALLTGAYPELGRIELQPGSLYALECSLPYLELGAGGIARFGWTTDAGIWLDGSRVYAGDDPAVAGASSARAVLDLRDAAASALVELRILTAASLVQIGAGVTLATCFVQEL